MRKTFSVGIVTYNSEKVISNVLNSLEHLSNRQDVEVYVVDNNSDDKTIEIIEENFKDVILIKNQINLGFGGANNQAIMQADSLYHVLVNPDITVEKDVFLQIQQFMDSNPDIVQMAPRVLNEDGTEQFLPKKNPKFKYLIAGKFDNHFDYFKKLRSEYTMEDKKVEETVDVDFCTGCFSVLRTEELKLCGGFDDRFFLYLEDADLTREMQKFGRTVYNPKIEVCHKWGRASGKSIKYFLIHLQSMFKYCWKWRS
ncbi:MAG: glycosyltransferase family 2 protein [Lachnospiraceae bacterium]|nr:glycosyltransferase family 2 protein [Lachnospiraceae bacterium]